MQRSKQDKSEKKTARRIGLAVLVAVLVVGAFLAGWYGRYGAIDPRMRGFLWAVDVTEKNFSGEFDEDRFYSDLYGTLTPDDYSRHYTEAEYREAMRESAGQNDGYGLSLDGSSAESEAVVALTVLNSPAYLAGLRAGMKIYSFSADGGETSPVTSREEFLTAVRSSGRCTLTAGYSPEETSAYALVRREYQATYCYYSDSEGSFAFLSSGGTPVLTEVTEKDGALVGADEKTAYLRIDEFSGNAAQEVRACLAKMKARGRENLVLDLRSNGGGALDLLVPIAAHLSRNAPEKTPLITSAKYKGGRTVRFAAAVGDFSDYFTSSSRFKILADEYTASASECLIGAMVDYGTVRFGDIVVRQESGRTYGKGIMQSHFYNDGLGGDGGVMKLTVATVHWPLSDRCIQGEGIGVKNGAHPVEAPLVCGETDPMLAYALGALTSSL